MVPRCSCCCPTQAYSKVKTLTNGDELRVIVSRPSATDIDDDGELFAGTLFIATGCDGIAYCVLEHLSIWL